MKLFQPWKIEIGHVNLLDQVDNAALIDEIHQLHCMSPRNSQTPLEITPEMFPALTHFRDVILRPLAEDYIQKIFNVMPKEVMIDTFGKAFDHQEGLSAHLHGNSCLTSVYYPEDSQAGMSLIDPRFNASRGYPRAVRDTHFGEHYISPKAGDLWLMPSYIQHSVAANPAQLRLSLINDFHFKA